MKSLNILSRPTAPEIGTTVFPEGIRSGRDRPVWPGHPAENHSGISSQLMAQREIFQYF